jgi:hypothetical protein
MTISVAMFSSHHFHLFAPLHIMLFIMLNDCTQAHEKVSAEAAALGQVEQRLLRDQAQLEQRLGEARAEGDAMRLRAEQAEAQLVSTQASLAAIQVGQDSRLSVTGLSSSCARYHRLLSLTRTSSTLISACLV